MRTLAHTWTLAALFALPLAVGWIPGTVLADDDNDRKSRQHREVNIQTNAETAGSQPVRRPGLTNLPVLTHDTVAYVQAGATDDGPAKQQDCDDWAGAINGLLDAL